MNKSIIAGLIGLAFTTNAFAQDEVVAITTEDILVKANRFEHKDTDTTYASEVHTAKQVLESGAGTLYDYLAQQTSLNMSSNYGSRATPAINLRGFGTENGYQNVVITVDGQRLNNIDGAPALLAGIPIGNIERIEIAKGSGSVIYGDGATAGAIQIYTKNKTGVTISTSLGNIGQQNHSITAGISQQYFDVSANLSHDGFDGFSKKDTTGHKDQFTGDTQNAKLKIKPTEYLSFFAEATSSRNDFRYINYLSKAQFKDNPRQNGGSAYTHQSFGTDQWKLGTEYNITDAVKLSLTHYQEDKKSDFITYKSVKDYDYRSNDVALSFNNEQISAIAGYQNFDGGLKSSSDTTSKDNSAFFINTEYRPAWISEALTLSAGARHEKVEYRYNPAAGKSLNDSESLNAWDIGANYRFTPELSMFANYNKSFQAPDIDRFFLYGGGFNGFIDPAKVRTFNVGLNHVTANNRLKVTAFHADLKDEIYLVPVIYKNTNLDKSHKYGLEIQDSFKFNNALNASIIYNYTRAIIDKDNDGAGTFNGNDLPGVPKHTVVANVNYQFLDHANLNLNHTYRSRAYAFNDFQNNFNQRQAYYESTNIALNYQYKNLNFFTSITNLFEHVNSIQVTDYAIYPVDFVRTWRVGMRADF